MALGLKPIQIIEKDVYSLLKINEKWTRVYIEEICEVQNGYAFSSKQFSRKRGIPLIRIRDISNGFTENFYTGTYSDEYIVEKGDLLIGMDGDFNVSRWKGKDALLNQRVCRLIQFSESYSNKFLEIVLQPYLNAINEETSSVTVKHLSSTTIKQIPVPLPPLNEQHRIVAKIEELFSALEHGEESLKRAQNQLKVYRQALLKYAFEGKLTEEWRLKNNPEPAGKLLERIKKARQERYDQEVEDWKLAVKQWGKDGKKGKRPIRPKRLEPSLPLLEEDIISVAVLPDTWSWIRLSEIGNLVSGQHILEKDYNERSIGIPYLTGPSDFGDIFPLITKWTDSPKALGQEKDILITVKGSGVGKINMMNYRAAISRQLMAFSPECEEWYTYFYLNSIFRKLQNLSTGTAIPGISRDDVLNLLFPLCDMNEQKQIVLELESHLSVIQNFEKTIDASFNKSQALRQLILKKAFEGKLVPQDSNDEPASELLKRIKKEKEAYLEEQKKLKKRAPKRVKKMSKKLTIKQVLETTKEPMSAKEVWQKSEHKDDIEAFYAELKKINDMVKEVKKGTESFLSLEEK